MSRASLFVGVPDAKPSCKYLDVQLKSAGFNYTRLCLDITGLSLRRSRTTGRDFLGLQAHFCNMLLADEINRYLQKPGCALKSCRRGGPVGGRLHIKLLFWFLHSKPIEQEGPILARSELIVYVSD